MEIFHKLTLRPEKVIWPLIISTPLLLLLRSTIRGICNLLLLSSDVPTPHCKHALTILHLFPPLSVLFFSSAIAILSFSALVLLYRISPYHPLGEFPGPFAARLNKLHYLMRILRGHQMREVGALHDRYGDIVRIGPDELSVCNVQAVDEIYSFKSTLMKGEWYDVNKPMTLSLKPWFAHLFALRDRTSHAPRRRAWEKAFTPPALVQFRPVIRSLTRQVTNIIDEQAAKGDMVRISDVMQFFQVDLMGHLAFGGGYTFLKDGDASGFMKDFSATMVKLSSLAHIQWVRPFLTALVTVIGEDNANTPILVRGKHETKRRIENPEKASKDIMHYLIENGVPASVDCLAGEAGLAMVAGGGTTSIAFTCATYLLCKHGYWSTLRAEVDAAFADTSLDDDLDPAILAKLPTLNAIINESLRLFPPVASGLQRLVPPGEGATVLGRYLPPGTHVSIAPWSIGRDARYWSRPNEFRPERWLKPEKEVEMEKQAFLPFLTGPWSCVGQKLAYLELQWVLATLARRYDLSLPPDFDEEKFLDGLHDFFALEQRVPLEVIARKRTSL